jgi:hypothetical protein
MRPDREDRIMAPTSKPSPRGDATPGPALALLIFALALLTAIGALLAPSPASAAEPPLPRLIEQNGRHALFVDGAPFLVLGAQVNNSSNYPDMLPEVWPVMRRLRVNTVEVPIAWEQVEPREGQFDLSHGWWRRRETCRCQFGLPTGITAAP